MLEPSKIFTGFRALGFVSNHIPLTLRYIKRRNENLAVTVVGKCFHTYGCDKLSLLSVSGLHPGDIDCLASDAYLVYTSCKNTIYAWRRGTELKHTYKGHIHNIHLLLPFGPHLLSVDENSTLIVWDIATEDVNLELPFPNSAFCISAILHPSTYINKILLGSQQGKLQLWNLRTSKMLFEFDGWGAKVTVLEQAPAIDVVGVGLENGMIYVHNLKFNETLMKFCQEWGAVTALSFRTDGVPLLASASPLGHIAVWDLEKKRLHSELREAHRKSVTGMKFLPNEPLMVTSSPDNSLKMWIFDMPDDSGRLLRLREGHSEPPFKIRFHGSSGKSILSAGRDSTLRSFSTLVDNLNKNLGQASFNRKVAKKKGILHDPGKMPPIIDFTSEITREKEWDNIAACHRGLSVVTTWSYDRCCMGEHKLLHERFRGERNVCALCLALSSCGNFVLIGYSSGHLDKFNIQSGIFRGTYGSEKAHEGNVRGVVCDGLNQVVISGGSDKLLKFWRFKNCALLSSVSLAHTVSHMIIHKDSGMIAVALDDFSVIVVDQETRKVVRMFEEHHGQITDMSFSSDSRWLVTASMDSSIRTWDLPNGSLLDCFVVSPPCISLSMSPSSEYLATVHANYLGIYLWSNKTLYSHVSLHSLPSDYEPRMMTLPTVSLEGKSAVSEDQDAEVLHDEQDMEVEFHSQEQIESLVTLSGLPNSHWQNLMNLDIIKMRNKPKEPVKVPKSAPFFLPVVSGLKPTFAVEESGDQEKEASDKLLQVMQHGSSFAELLVKCSEREDYTDVIKKLKGMSPSLIDVEIRCLSPENGGSVNAMMCFMKAINESLNSHKDFEVVNSYLALFLQIHGALITSTEELWTYLNELRFSNTWQILQTRLNHCLCLAKYLRSVVL